MERRFLNVHDVEPWVADTLGDGRRLLGLARLRGGTKKGVYRLTFDRGPSLVLYLWGADENYWPGRADRVSDEAWSPFTEASSLDYFAAANQSLRSISVSTPAMLFSAGGGGPSGDDFALVEDAGGTSLESVMATDPAQAKGVLIELREALLTMAGDTRGRIGKASAVEAGAVPGESPSCEDLVLARAFGDIDEAARRVDELGVVRTALTEELSAARERVLPRDRLSLVHGELGPDHVLVDGNGRPSLIDIEGLMYFDVEWEHAFLEMRFHDSYAHLRIDGLDEARLHLYRLAQHLSLVAGPLRLLDGDFPDRAFMKRIVDHNVRCVLGFVRGSDQR